VALPPRHRLVAQPTIERESLRDEDVVLWPRELGSGYYDRIVSQIWGNGRPRIAIEEPDDGEILAAVANGSGIGIVELHRAMQLLPSAVVLRHFADPVPTTGLGVAWLNGYSSPLVEAFVAICRVIVRAS
jgi:DNA-binding transcriptional LysR family regulator